MATLLVMRSLNNNFFLTTLIASLNFWTNRKSLNNFLFPLTTKLSEEEIGPMMSEMAFKEQWQIINLLLRKMAPIGIHVFLVNQIFLTIFIFYFYYTSI